MGSALRAFKSPDLPENYFRVEVQMKFVNKRLLFTQTVSQKTNTRLMGYYLFLNLTYLEQL